MSYSTFLYTEYKVSAFAKERAAKVRNFAWSTISRVFIVGLYSVLGKNSIEKRKLLRRVLMEDLDLTKTMSLWVGMEVKSSSTRDSIPRPATRTQTINLHLNQPNYRFRIVFHVDLAASTFCAWSWRKPFSTKTASSYWITSEGHLSYVEAYFEHSLRKIIMCFMSRQMKVPTESRFCRMHQFPASCRF